MSGVRLSILYSREELGKGETRTPCKGPMGLPCSLKCASSAAARPRAASGMSSVTQLTSFWARAARRRNAEVTWTLERAPEESFSRSSRGSDSVMESSSAVRMVLGTSVESRGRSERSGMGGWTAARVAARWSWARWAMDCHGSGGREDLGEGSMEGEARLEWRRE